MYCRGEGGGGGGGGGEGGEGGGGGGEERGGEGRGGEGRGGEGRGGQRKEALEREGRGREGQRKWIARDRERGERGGGVMREVSAYLFNSDLKCTCIQHGRTLATCMSCMCIHVVYIHEALQTTTGAVSRAGEALQVPRLGPN